MPNDACKNTEQNKICAAVRGSSCGMSVAVLLHSGWTEEN